jgi:uncharacterized protein
VPDWSFPFVTALTASLLALLQAGLSLYASLGRAKYDVGIGDGASDGMIRRIRMHGNLTENAPIFLILLGLVEMTARHPKLVAALGPTFMICRISHAFGLSLRFGPGTNPFRFIGAVGTLLALVTLSVVLLLALYPRFPFY